MEPDADKVFVASHFNIIEPNIYVLSPMYLLPKMSLRTKHRQPLARLDYCARILRKSRTVSDECMHYIQIKLFPY